MATCDPVTELHQQFRSDTATATPWADAGPAGDGGGVLAVDGSSRRTLLDSLFEFGLARLLDGLAVLIERHPA